MKQSEKLDLILRELYKYKNRGKYLSIGYICQSLEIPLDSILELRSLSKRLETDGYIKTIFTRDDCNADLTSYGIEYCEETSYSYSGHSVITNNYSISIVNSPNSNIVNQSSNVEIFQNSEDINQIIEKIRETITVDDAISSETASNILDCLNEIQECVKNQIKPKSAIKSLIDISGSISSIASWATTLGQLLGIIKI